MGKGKKGANEKEYYCHYYHMAGNICENNFVPFYNCGI